MQNHPADWRDGGERQLYNSGHSEITSFLRQTSCIFSYIFKAESSNILLRNNVCLRHKHWLKNIIIYSVKKLLNVAESLQDEAIAGSYYDHKLSNC